MIANWRQVIRGGMLQYRVETAELQGLGSIKVSTLLGSGGAADDRWAPVTSDSLLILTRSMTNGTLQDALHDASYLFPEALKLANIVSEFDARLYNITPLIAFIALLTLAIAVLAIVQHLSTREFGKSNVRKWMSNVPVLIYQDWALGLLVGYEGKEELPMLQLVPDAVVLPRMDAMDAEKVVLNQDEDTVVNRRIDDVDV
ncbi:hypothetical protein HDV00_008142 [Rhizophlyctis rosea]|nr:hypothetical protein HDV00_008142 [Rhizophlyctis rosea]